MKDIQLEKRQVKGLIDTMKLNTRESLKNGIVQEGALHFIGDGKFVITIDLNDSNINGKISFEALEVWYKLSVASDYLTVDKLISMVVEWNETESLPPLNIEGLYSDKQQEIDSISFDPKYLNIISRVLNNQHTTLSFSGTYKPIKVSNHDIKSIKCLLMPVRTGGGTWNKLKTYQS